MQTQIKYNLNTKHGSITPPITVYPLDGYTLPKLAYSFMKLRSAYTGNCVRLRRVSDSDERDFGFGHFANGHEWVNISGIITWAGASAWVVVDFYNQAEATGTTNPLTQKNTSEQPTGDITGINSLPCYTYDSNDYLQTTGTLDLTANEMSLISISKRNGAIFSAYHTMFTFADTVSSVGTNYILVYCLSTGSWRAVHQGGVGNWTISGTLDTDWHAYVMRYDRPNTTLRVWEDNVLRVTLASSPVLGNKKFFLGEFLNRNFNGSQEAFIVWDTAEPQDDLLAISAILETAYGI